ncbi:MAG TPA: ATP-binding protein [Sporichthyaceae bacterium]|jgi:signal transduction histidine kinase|nr:ATP-binding protein [Sporichthyaceae bacterium]
MNAPEVSTDTGVRLAPEELRRLFLFEHLDDEQLAWVAERGWVSAAPAGSIVLREGDPAQVLIMLLSGSIRLTQRVGRDEVEVNRSEMVGAYAGAMRAFVKDSTAQQYTVTAQVLTDSRLFVLPAQSLVTLMETWFPMALHLLDGMFVGMRNSQETVGRREQLLALGALTAGLTHELNNPAAAAVRAAAALRERVGAMRQKLASLADDDLDRDLLRLLVDIQEEAVLAAAKAPDLSALAAAEREDEIADWMDRHGVSGGWELAPVFAAGGTTDQCLDKIASGAPPEVVEGALRWLASTLETETLLTEITDSVTRISTLIGAAKQYSHMDRTPYEPVDIHLGLKSTLMLLAGKAEGLTIVKEFDRTLPPVPAYPAELNQVWTNLIDNAIQAMGGAGTLTVRTTREDNCARVEICDTGPGVPEELRLKIFQPFFTTKPVGQGTGLGLDISYRIVVERHGGDLSVQSVPGDTRFIVRLPLTERQT